MYATGEIIVRILQYIKHWRIESNHRTLNRASRIEYNLKLLCMGINEKSGRTGGTNTVKENTFENQRSFLNSTYPESNFLKVCHYYLLARKKVKDEIKFSKVRRF